MKTLLFLIVCGTLLQAGAPVPQVLVDDGGWCWFEDERVVLHDGKLIIGTVAAGTKDPRRKGNIEVTVVDRKTGAAKTVVLHAPAEAERRRWHDDHNSPAFWVRPDGRVLATYSLHGVDEKKYYRISEPGDATKWGPEQIFVPSPTSRVTYTNLHYLSAEKRLYDFFRGVHNSYKPSYLWSEDFGDTWKTGGVVIQVPTEFRHRPYVKYASNGVDTVHLAYTEGHPRNYDNSIYHIAYKGGDLRRSDGSVIAPLTQGLTRPEDGTLVYKGDKNNVAWISDLHIDKAGRPFLVFSVQKDSAGLPDGKAGEDHRYHYARWTGQKWQQHEIAYAGSKLYPGEDDYTGNIAVDPQDPNTVVISTNADPDTGKRMPHRELYQGVTKDGEARFTWTALTKDSAQDNIRPIIPIRKGGARTILWLRGVMRTYTNYDFEVVALGVR
ncbi:MAG: BNR-4 repeat-containing protein [Bryobacterales bacterium]|nr:BNR-4 repeat-containing protein [Bryobacterales bacterium]